MTTAFRLLVNKREIGEARIETSGHEPLRTGNVRLAIERFALTANNISYAATGDLLRYWQFFPAPEGWGCVPAWGFATVVESTVAGLESGDRFWGLLPMGSELVVTPGRLTPGGFFDAASHRATLAPIYNEYSRCSRDAMHVDGQEDIESLLRPLYGTAWLVDDFMADNHFFGADVVLLSSASSKTAYGTAARLAQRQAIRVIGLTARSNVGFVESLGCYHDVIAYEELERLDPNTRAVYLDFAGAASVRRAVHESLPQLRYSCSIGGSHLDRAGSAAGLPGPKPIFMFVPAQVAKRVADWGMASLMERMAHAWHGFVHQATDPAHPWISVCRHHGPTGLCAAYARILEGKSDPRTGHVVMPSTTAAGAVAA